MHATTTRPTSPRALALVLAVAALAGCATTGRGPAVDVRWPLPPDTARIKYVRTIATEYDLEVSGWRAFSRIFVPPDPGAVVGNTTGLALSPDERSLYVASASTGSVLRVDFAAGRITRVAAEEGRRPAVPHSLAVDAEGNLFVADRAGEIWVFSPEDKFLRRFGADHLDRPTGIAIDRKRQLLYVVDGSQVKSQNHRVEVFSLRGEHLRTIGTRGAAPSQFNFPTNVAVAPDGRLYVVDMLNFRVQVFDADGGLLSMFGAPGAGAPGTFDKAKAVALDTFGNAYVVDSAQGFVQLFNPQHQPLMAFGGQATLPGYMGVPNCIVIDSRNTIYVGDFARRAVNVYQLINTTAEDSLPPTPEAPATPGGRTDHPGEKPQDG
ncbi:MAG: SMP-30/gluconolactonase/LRE family protein [Anaeromyxobacteraceae bacterium]|nr:SMP-30/gluconolactonase/LRE family protein [Anaeromyxobacteraceae bacterium]